MKKNPTDIFLFADKNNDKKFESVHKLKRKSSDVPDKPNNVKRLLTKKISRKKKVHFNLIHGYLILVISR